MGTTLPAGLRGDLAAAHNRAEIDRAAQCGYGVLVSPVFRPPHMAGARAWESTFWRGALPPTAQGYMSMLGGVNEARFKRLAGTVAGYAAFLAFIARCDLRRELFLFLYSLNNRTMAKVGCDFYLRTTTNDHNVLAISVSVPAQNMPAATLWPGCHYTLGACADDIAEDDYPTKGNTADAESGRFLRPSRSIWAA